jgi:hypothetical protein
MQTDLDHRADLGQQVVVSVVLVLLVVTLVLVLVVVLEFHYRLRGLSALESI